MFVDTSIIIIYLVIMIAIGYFIGRDNKNQQDYFLAGRNMPWFAIALSVAATMLSANSFVGGPGWAYTDGMLPFMVNITVPLAISFAIVFTMPVFIGLQVTSIYEYIGLRFGNASRLLAIAQFFINSLIQLSSMVFIPALIIQTMTGWDLRFVVTVIVLISILYTILGGIKAVIWTDTLQMLILWFGVFFSLYHIISHLDISLLDTLSLAKAEGKFAMLDFSLNINATGAFWASLLGGTAMWIRYFSFDQVQVQRLLTSKSLNNSKKSLLASALLMNIVYALMLFIGILLYYYYKGAAFEQSNMVMITFILEELPVGIIGLIISAVFSAAMSSVDSILNSMTTVFVQDIYQYYFSKNNQQEASLKLSMIVSTVIGAVVIVIILFAFGSTVRSVLDIVGKYISYFSGPALGIFTLAMFTKKANDFGASTGAVLGFLTVLVSSYTLQPAWIWNPFIGFLSTFMTGYILSLFMTTSNRDGVKYTAKQIRINATKGTLFADKEPIIDKYALVAFLFFILQYVFIALIQYT